MAAMEAVLARCLDDAALRATIDAAAAALPRAPTDRAARHRGVGIELPEEEPS
jgi:hypothetical protein